MRIGIGYDIHRLEEGRNMVLGGVQIPHDRGPRGHSDGDALLHAICDAILGAMGKEDIGTRYPDTDPEFKDASSMEFLRDIAEDMDKAGFAVSSLDCVVIAEEPKIGPVREKIIDSITEALKAPRGRVNVKGKTAEKIGDVGEGRAIEAHAVVLLEEK